MKKYTYLVNFDSQTLERVGESFAVKGDGGIAELEFAIPSNFGIPANQALWRVFFRLPGEKDSLFETLPAVTATESGDYVTAWVISKAITQKAGRLAFSLAAISGNDVQWNSRTVIMQVPESQYQPESEEAEEPYTGRLDALEGSMAAIRGEFAEVQDDFEELKETATLGTPIPKSLASEMVEGGVYLYTGSEPGYTAGHLYYYVNGTLTDGGQYGGTTVDATLTVSGAAADAKAVGDEIAEIKEDLSAKQDTLAFDTTPTENSTNPVTSGGVATALANVTIPVDATLTQSGEAADAKATGDAIDALFAGEDSTLEWEVGTISVNTGVDFSSRLSCRTIGYIEYTAPLTVTLADGVRYSWRRYSASKAYISSSDWITTSGTLEFTDGEYIRLTCAYIDGTAPITVAAAAESVVLSVPHFTDRSLSLLNKAADAKATGDAIAAVNAAANAANTETLAIVNAVIKNEPENAIAFIDAGAGAIISDGSTNTSTTFNHTDYVDVSSYGSIRYKQNTYRGTTSAGMAFYDNDKNLVSFTAGAADDTKTRYRYSTVSVPENAVYARFSIFTDTTTYGTFELYGSSKLHTAVAAAVEADYNLSDRYEAADNVAIVTTTAEVYALYDALVSNYPGIVTKNTLTDETDTTFSVYEYVFTFGNINDADRSHAYPVDAEIEKPVILISSGTHGYERSAVLSLYTVMRDMCAGAESLSEIAENATIKVLPVVCPYGFDHNSRINANGVNINRNFDTDNWTLITSNPQQYSGAEPADQPETRVYQGWIDANTGALAHADIHNSEVVAEISNALGQNSAYKKRVVAGVQKVAPHWREDRSISSSSNIFCYTAQDRASTTGSTVDYAAKAGISRTCIIELSWNVNSTGKHSNATIGVGAEVIGNFLISMNNVATNVMFK